MQNLLLLCGKLCHLQQASLHCGLHRMLGWVCLGRKCLRLMPHKLHSLRGYYPCMHNLHQPFLLNSWRSLQMHWTSRSHLDFPQPWQRIVLNLLIFRCQLCWLPVQCFPQCGLHQLCLYLQTTPRDLRLRWPQPVFPGLYLEYLHLVPQPHRFLPHLLPQFYQQPSQLRCLCRQPY